MRVHLDTDIGGNPDDVAALAMLLGWGGVELVGVTTVDDPDGMRAACAAYVLALCGRPDAPVVAGATAIDGDRVPHVGRALWPDLPAPDPARPGAAETALATAVESGAVVVAIGPLTNLALLGRSRGDLLSRARLVVMGGWVGALGPDLPPWGPQRDWNVVRDPVAAREVLGSGADLTLVTLASTLRTAVRRRDLSALRSAGEVGQLLAEQVEHWARQRGHEALGATYAGLPDDLLLFLHDPLTAAVALGWPGAHVELRRLRPTVAPDGVVTMAADVAAPEVGVVTDVDGAAFAERWLAAIRAVGSGGFVARVPVVQPPPDGVRGSSHVDRSPGDRVAALVEAIGLDAVVAWCADLLAGRADGTDPDLPPLTWLGGRHALALLDHDQVHDPTHAHWPRVWAARGLLHAYDTAAAREVVAALGDEAWRVREMAAKVVARWEVGAAAEAVALLVADEVARVRAAAVRALGAVGEAEHAAVVRDAMDDAEPAVRRAAETALRGLRVRLDRDL